jgi:hypothetical protein
VQRGGEERRLRVARWQQDTVYVRLGWVLLSRSSWIELGMVTMEAVAIAITAAQSKQKGIELQD